MEKLFKLLIMTQPTWHYFAATACVVAWIAMTTTWTWNLVMMACFWAPANWTFQEYMIHRFVLHGPMLARLHGKHHESPHDTKRVFVPIGLTIALCLCHYLPLTLLWSHEIGMTNVLSQILCYWCFEWIHYDCHVMRSAFSRGPRRFHTIHHGNTGVNYGFTSATWDIVFGTCDDTHRPWWPILCIPIPLIPLMGNRRFPLEPPKVEPTVPP